MASDTDRHSLRSRLIGWGADALFNAASFAAGLRSDASPGRYGIERRRNISYGPGEAQTLDVYLPPCGGKGRPWILYVHGGGFRILSKDTHWMMAMELCKRGYVVFNINYRLAPTHPFPAGLEDAATALGWALDHARFFGAEPEDFSLAGESAGANLAAALTIACTTRRPEPFASALFERQVVPRCLISLCGMLEVSNEERYLSDESLSPLVRSRIAVICRSYLGPLREQDALFLANPLWALESTETFERNLPPVFASVGERDPILDDTKRLEAALKRRGTHHDIRYYADQIHAFQALYWSEAGQQSWNDLGVFLEGLQISKRSAK